MKRELQSTDMVKAVVSELSTVPPGRNAYQIDSVRSGVMLSAGWEAMFEMSKLVLDEVVLVNQHTGQRILVKFEVQSPQPDAGAVLTPDDFAIWWTNSAESQPLDNSPYIQEGGREFYEFARGWPEYLQSEIRSRIGRAGRGALWVSPEHIGLFPDLPEDLDYGRFGECGGVVFLKEHLHHLAGMPGTVTDRHLNEILH